jgi:hypothetical protein
VSVPDIPLLVAALLTAAARRWCPDSWIGLLIMCDLGAVPSRGDASHAHQIEAERRAINLQESLAIMLDRAHQTDTAYTLWLS